MEPTPKTDSRRWFGLALLCSAFFMVILDVAIVNVALPSIQADLAFSQRSLQWVVSAYALTFGGLLLLGGRAADLLGRRRVFVAGVAVFALASLLGGLAPSGGAVDRRAGPAGTRRGGDDARRALDPDDDVSRGPRAQQGARRLGRRRGLGRHDRPASRRRDRGDRRLGVDLLPQRSRRRRGDRAEPRSARRDPGARRGSPFRSRRGGDRDGRAFAARVCLRRCRDGWLERRCRRSALAGDLGVLLAAFVAIELRSAAPLVPFRIFRLSALLGSNVAGVLFGAAVYGMFFIITLYLQRGPRLFAAQGRPRLAGACR